MDYLVLLKKDLATIPGKFAECYAFSIHKAGSTLMHKMIAQVCRSMQIPAISIPDVMFLEGINSEEWENDLALLELITPGRIYFGFRNLPEILLDQQIRLREKKVGAAGARSS